MRVLSIPHVFFIILDLYVVGIDVIVGYSIVP